jgi:hypothetical protein
MENRGKLWPLGRCFRAPPARSSETVDIQIVTGSTHPPVGRVVADDGVARPFQGWLQLLRILADLLGNGAEDAAPSGPGQGRVIAQPTAGGVAGQFDP